MARPHLTEYLLRLAWDADEQARLKSDTDTARQATSAAGLTPEQHHALVSGDRQLLREAVNEELSKSVVPPDDDVTFRLCFQVHGTFRVSGG